VLRPPRPTHCQWAPGQQHLRHSYEHLCADHLHAEHDGNQRDAADRNGEHGMCPRHGCSTLLLKRVVVGLVHAVDGRKELRREVLERGRGDVRVAGEQGTHVQDMDNASAGCLGGVHGSAGAGAGDAGGLGVGNLYLDIHAEGGGVVGLVSLAQGLERRGCVCGGERSGVGAVVRKAICVKLGDEGRVNDGLGDNVVLHNVDQVVLQQLASRGTCGRACCFKWGQQQVAAELCDMTRNIMRRESAVQLRHC
jgi:hypothetical protein